MDAKDPEQTWSRADLIQSRLELQAIFSQQYLDELSSKASIAQLLRSEGEGEGERERGGRGGGKVLYPQQGRDIVTKS